MNRGLSRALACLLVCLLPWAALAAPGFSDYALLRAENQRLAAGLDLWRYELISRSDPARRQLLHVLAPKPEDNPRLRFRVVSREGLVKGLQPTSQGMAWLQQQAPGLRPLAAINGDFFDMRAGGALGLTVDEGRLKQSGEFSQGWSLGFDAQGRARIGQPRLDMRLSAKRQGQTVVADVPIDALNALRADIAPGQSTPNNAYQARMDNHLVLYTSDYYRATMAPDGGYELRLDTEDSLRPDAEVQARVSAVHKSGKVTVAGTAAIPQGMPLGKGHMALSATGPAAEPLRGLRLGDQVSIRADLSPDWSDLPTILGGGRPDGGPLLVKDGHIQPEHPEVDDYQYFYPSAHARTAAGIRPDGSFFLLVAEGYQPGIAEGLSVAELAQIMIDLGADIALNLDGGPSSTLALPTQGGFAAVTSPGRRGETAVGNSLVICEEGP